MENPDGHFPFRIIRSVPDVEGLVIVEVEIIGKNYMYLSEISKYLNNPQSFVSLLPQTNKSLPDNPVG